ncbi:hypothetical protein DH2020_049741 [Rehmannia glutinosa]|uniref:Uncharacterized protein n=1 Tax=Rehmannia glutinosa TaxID=99300 RepID=A0ABR0U2N9_REHGL
MRRVRESQPALTICLPLCWFMGSLVLGKGARELFYYLKGWCLIKLIVQMPFLARELFYYLKGGQVDYGEEHSKACGHSQFGRIYEKGHYPEWDEDHPIHFVGHSAGAQVVRVLQQMLADRAFKGYENTSPNWVLSITSLSGAFNGTTRTYLDGMQPEDGKSLKPISLLQLCRIGVILYDWFDVQWLKEYYNFGFDHFNMSRKKIGIWGLVNCLMGKSGPFASGDWILPDLTLQGSIRLNSHIQTFPDTYYFSYATKRTRKIMGVTVPSGLLGIHPLLFIRVLQMSQWRHPPDVTPPYKGYRYYKIVEGDHILFIVNRERAGVQFDLIYDSIFERCRKHAFRRTPTLPNQLGEMSRITFLGHQSLSYFSNKKNMCWFLEPKLEEEIKNIHNLVGNAMVEDRHIIVGTGSSQLIQAALYALSDHSLNEPNTISVVSASPYYSVSLFVP